MKQQRLLMPKIGTRKLYYLLENELRLLKVGRDKLFKILKANQLLIKPKRKYHITTNSHHRFRKHKNQIKELEFTRPEQIWVSDITYIGNRKNPSYLALITDYLELSRNCLLSIWTNRYNRYRNSGFFFNKSNIV